MGYYFLDTQYEKKIMYFLLLYDSYLLSLYSNAWTSSKDMYNAYYWAIQNSEFKFLKLNVFRY